MNSVLSAITPQTTGTALPHIHGALRAWYAREGRKTLPWRITHDPYAIYISEVMLQQTQVQTVLDRYYFPFLDRFPTLQALADASVQEVLKVWEGLGYYSRARNLHKAAQLAAPALPQNIEALLALPGIGCNTAHAIAAFAWHQPVPVMEANVKRVLCRIFALEQPTDKDLWGKAELLLDRKDPFTYNQAMMDIGAYVCIKRQPACGVCPLSPVCVGKQNPAAYPAPKKKKQTPVRERVILVLEDGQGRLLLTRRSENFLGGLYGFPQLHIPSSCGLTAGSILSLCGDMDPAVKPQDDGILPLIKKASYLGPLRQTYSHFTLVAEVYLLRRTDPDALPVSGLSGKGDSRWGTPEEIAALPLSRADHKVLDMLKTFLRHKNVMQTG